jgi:glycosyltransferase involved in cell wall biosynthesis
MRISVVIATRNRASLLAATLEQLRSQPFAEDDEVIVVDNGSTDDTQQVLSRASAAFPVRFVQLQERASGKSPALNTGIAASRGDVLALTDDDVLVADDWLAEVRRIFSDPAIDLAGGRVDPRWERPAPRWMQVEQDGRYGRLASPLALLHYGEAQSLGQRTAVGANLSIRRRVWEELGGFANHLGRRTGTLLCGEDHDFCQRAVTAGFRCEYRPELRVRHWVPAERTRLAYHLRWFYWSGITNAILEREARQSSHQPSIPGYLIRTLLTVPFSAAGQLLRGRPVESAMSLMSAAFSLGYVVQSLKNRRHAGPTTTASDAGRVMAPARSRDR